MGINTRSHFGPHNRNLSVKIYKNGPWQLKTSSLKSNIAMIFESCYLKAAGQGLEFIENVTTIMAQNKQ